MTKDEALTLALEAHCKNERHRTLAETRYWCDQYKLLAQQAIKALAQPEQDLIPKEDLFVCKQMDAHVTRVYAPPEQEKTCAPQANKEVWRHHHGYEQEKACVPNECCTPDECSVKPRCLIRKLSPKSEWVGLTDEEVKNLWLSIGAEPIEVRLIEAKLKELNK